MKIGDRVKILDCVYGGEDVCKGNTGVIVKLSATYDDMFIVNTDAGAIEWPYMENELEVVV